jgi:predicted RNA-binding Zn-ribbon protein involved in translation (DUF1610 family)
MFDMATFSAGICTKCNEYILLKDGIPFLVCPICGANIGFREATENLKKRCADGNTVHTVIADAIALELNYGAELPFRILTTVAENFPRMEEPAYLLVRLSGYDRNLVRAYLEQFSEIKSDKGNISWAQDFLDTIITYGNMDFAELIEQYIENKLPQNKKRDYLDRVQKLKEEYRNRSNDPRSTKLLFAIYIVGAVLNVLILPLLMITPFSIILTFPIAMALLVVEMGFMFWHNRSWGNRLGVEGKEKLLMVIFLCSMFFALGAGVIAGAPLFKIFK